MARASRPSALVHTGYRATFAQQDRAAGQRLIVLGVPDAHAGHKFVRLGHSFKHYAAGKKFSAGLRIYALIIL